MASSSDKVRFKVFLPGGRASAVKTTLNVVMNPTDKFVQRLLALVRQHLHANADEIRITSPDNVHTCTNRQIASDVTAGQQIPDHYRDKTFKVEACHFRNVKDTALKPYNGNSTATPNWPIDFPFTVKTPVGGAFRLNKDDFGMIQSLAMADGTIAVTRADGTNGRVHCKNIYIGNTRKYGVLKVTTSVPASLSVSVAAAATGQGQSYRAIKALLDEMFAKADMLEFDPEMIDTDEKRTAWTKRIEKGIMQVNNGALHAQLQRSNFTRRDIINNAVPITSRHKNKPMIYWRDYENFTIDKKPNKDILPHFNLGSSIDGYGRQQQHDRELNNVRSGSDQHYKMGSCASKRGAYVFCQVDTNETSAMKLFEMIPILLLEAQRPALLGLDTEGAFPSSRASAYYRDATNPGNEHRESMRLAAMLRTVADAAKRVSGWPGGTSRPEFRAIGNNWNSPIHELMSGERVAWSLHRSSNGTMHFTRYVNHLTAIQGETQLQVFKFTQKYYYRLRKPLADALSYSVRSADGKNKTTYAPKAGDSISFTVEITPQGHIHPRSYLKLAKIMSYNDQNHLMRFAIRLTWKGPTGQFRQVYDERPLLEAQLLDKKDMYSNGMIAHTRGMMNFFLHESYSNAPSWQPEYGQARVFEASFNHLIPSLTLTPVVLNPKPRPYPALTTRDMIKQRLQQLGAQNIDGKPGMFGPQRNSSGQILKYEWSSSRNDLWDQKIPKGTYTKAQTTAKAQRSKYPFDFNDTPGRWVVAPPGHDGMMTSNPVPDNAPVTGVWRARLGDCDRAWIAKWPRGANTTVPHPKLSAETKPSAVGGPHHGQNELCPRSVTGPGQYNKRSTWKLIPELKDTCFTCSRAGLVCCFTDTKTLEENGALVQFHLDTGAEALRLEESTKETEGSAIDVDDPSFVLYTINRDS